MSDKEVVYVVKYALSGSVRKTTVERRDGKYVWVAWPDRMNGHALFTEKDVASTVETAAEAVQKMVRKKIASLKKQISTLEPLLDRKVAINLVVEGER
jgi:hypothetical protein